MLELQSAVKRPTLVLVGGFLGAGKTSLIARAVETLAHEGLRSAVVLNDQSEHLLDTEWMRQHGMHASEVVGGCFCCRFSDFLEAAGELAQSSPDVVFAEPVGSCVDLAATVIRPLQALSPAEYRVAPFTVLVDPSRHLELTGPEADPYMSYLFHHQIEEADLVCFTKSDLYSDVPGIPAVSTRRVSASSGQGVKEWLDEVLRTNSGAGQYRMDLDYSEYALAEASLAWLNFNADLKLASPEPPASVVGPLLEAIQESLVNDSIRIAHIKAASFCSSGFLKAAVCANDEQPKIEGHLYAAPCLSHRLVLNVRAAGKPERVEALIRPILARVSGRWEHAELNCFAPPAPRPEYRMSE